MRELRCRAPACPSGPSAETGGHRNAESTLALAEMAYAAGYHVVTIPSTLNFEFIENASTVKFCGFPVCDSRDTHRALTAVERARNDDGD